MELINEELQYLIPMENLKNKPYQFSQNTG